MRRPVFSRPGPQAGNTRQRGSEWEAAAETLLQQRGLTTVARNFHGRIGEIDLVMLDGQTLVFIEVRYRRDDGHGSGAASVIPAKQRRITFAAKRFLQKEKRYAHRACRFDVVSIGRKEGRTLMNWIKGAFNAA